LGPALATEASTSTSTGTCTCTGTNAEASTQTSAETSASASAPSNGLIEESNELLLVLVYELDELGVLLLQALQDGRQQLWLLLQQCTDLLELRVGPQERQWACCSSSSSSSSLGLCWLLNWLGWLDWLGLGHRLTSWGLHYSWHCESSCSSAGSCSCSSSSLGLRWLLCCWLRSTWLRRTPPGNAVICPNIRNGIVFIVFVLALALALAAVAEELWRDEEVTVLVDHREPFISLVSLVSFLSLISHIAHLLPLQSTTHSRAHACSSPSCSCSCSCLAWWLRQVLLRQCWFDVRYTRH
jgi:hypothetical protein